jgi:hypothetical protein
MALGEAHANAVNVGNANWLCAAEDWLCDSDTCFVAYVELAQVVRGGAAVAYCAFERHHVSGLGQVAVLAADL